MTERLPGVNFQAPLATDDLEFQQNSNGEEIQERTRLIMAGSYGIVDSTDPKDISNNDLGRPLNVLPSTDPIRVDVSAGSVVTANGNWVRLEEKLFLFPLASEAVGSVNVVFIEYFLESGSDRRVNKFNVDVAVRQQRPAENQSVIKVATISNFLDPAQFSPDRRKDTVVLGIVTVNQLPDLTKEIVIDLGTTNFSFNRPWFSPKDVEHRNRIGTAEPTDNNPHGTSLNDLAAAQLTLYQQVVPHGLVLSKDVDVPKVPGIKETETIQSASFTVDTTGLVTSREPLYGGIGAKWANLQHFPINLGSVYETGSPSIQIAASFVPDTNILVIPAGEPLPDAGLTIEYLFSQAGEVPVSPATNDLTFSQPAESELIVADGIAVDTIPTPSISFDGSGPIPRDFRVLIDAEGSLISTPQILLPAVKLAAIGIDTPQIITRGMRGDAPIEIGMTRAANVAGMEVSILLSGTSPNNQPISEILTFSFGTYQDSSIPATEEEQDQFVRSSSLFRTLNSITVLNRINDGNDSTIIVYADQEAAVTSSFQEKCPLADLFWDGLGISSVFDARPITLNMELPETPVFNAIGSPALGAKPWLYEDLRRPRYLDSFSGDAEARAAKGSISITNNANIADGDTINLGGGKVLTANLPVQATGSISALPFGVNIGVGFTAFIVNEGPSSGSFITVALSNGLKTPAQIATQLALSLTASSSVGLTYSGSASSNREIIITATGNFNIASTALSDFIGLSFRSGSNAYTGDPIPGLADGDLFTINDGELEKTFEFDVGGGLNNSAHVAVSPAGAEIATDQAVKDAMLNAINNSDLSVTAFSGAGLSVNLVNDTPGALGNNTITESINTGFTLNPIGMSGGSDGDATPAMGGFNVGKDAETTVDNIVTTLNNTSFSSGITGSSATINTFPSVSLVKNEAGLLNDIITESFANSPSPILIEGFEKGTNRYIGTSPDSFAEGLRTRIPEAGVNLDLIRKKYRSQALAVPVSFSSPVQKASVILQNPGNVNAFSVRTRAALSTNPGNWQAHAFMDLVETNPNFVRFEKDFGVNVQKIQLEMFGKFTEFSLLDVSGVGVVGQGPTGPAGPSGPAGESIVGPTGAPGQDGQDGQDGATGATGPGVADIKEFVFSSQSVWTVSHNMNTTIVSWATYNPQSEAVIPDSVEIIDPNTIEVTWAVPTEGKIVITGSTQ